MLMAMRTGKTEQFNTEGGSLPEFVGRYYFMIHASKIWCIDMSVARRCRSGVTSRQYDIILRSRSRYKSYMNFGSTCKEERCRKEVIMRRFQAFHRLELSDLTWQRTAV